MVVQVDLARGGANQLLFRKLSYNNFSPKPIVNINYGTEEVIELKITMKILSRVVYFTSQSFLVSKFFFGNPELPDDLES